MLNEFYRKEVDRLTAAGPDAIREAWHAPWGGSYPQSPLFAYVTPDGAENRIAGFGCLTQIRRGDCTACTPWLTKRIRADKRIPVDENNLMATDLEVFAEWQQTIDAEIRPKPLEEIYAGAGQSK
jgi:hypothetical protein